MDAISRILNEGADHHNAAGQHGNTYILPEHGSGKNDINALALSKGWQQQAITISTNVAGFVPVNQIVVPLFQFIQSFGVVNQPGTPNGSVFIQDTGLGFVAGTGAIITAQQSTYAALRSQTSNRAMRVHYIRMSYTDVNNQLGLPLQWVFADTFGDFGGYTFPIQSFKDPWQQQNNLVDIPTPTDETKKRNVVREDSGYNVAINPNQSITLNFFYSAWGSAGHDIVHGKPIGR